MWDTLAVTYEGTSQVKRNKLSVLTCKYELFSMEENEDIKCMLTCFQTIHNELISLGRTYDNYDHIDKILIRLSRKWGWQVTTLRALKNFESMSFEELVGTLKIHEQELQQDEGLRTTTTIVKGSCSTRPSIRRKSYQLLTTIRGEVP